MAMATHEEELLQEEEEDDDDFWCLQLQRGEEITLIPYDDEPFLVTDVFLVDPESAASQGVVSAWVKMGTWDIMLAQLSSEVTNVELQTPVVLDEEFFLYVMRPDTDDSDGDGDADNDAIVVQFEGYMLSPDEESAEDEEAGSSDDDDDGIEEESEEDEESDGEVEGDAASASSAKE